MEMSSIVSYCSIIVAHILQKVLLVYTAYSYYTQIITQIATHVLPHIGTEVGGLGTDVYRHS